MTTLEVLQHHLRALEIGDWDTVNSYISDSYKATGVIPFPISLFIKLRKKDALTMHKARKIALPDFKFNESVLESDDEKIKIEVNITGTQTGVIDYRGILRGIPVVEPTGKFVKLNPEYFTYFVKNGKIEKVEIDIPKNAGVKGLVKAVTENI